jgi:hypothetical protein
LLILSRYSPLGAGPIDYSKFTESFLTCGGYYIDALLEMTSPSNEITKPDLVFYEALILVEK